MSVQHLGVGRPVAVPAGQVEIELVDAGGTGAQLDVVSAETEAPFDTVRLSPTRVVMASPDEAVLVVGRAPGDAAFRNGAEVQLVVHVGDGPLRATLVSPRNDVGALRRLVLLRITPRGDTVEVAALKLDDAAIPAEEEPLPPLARRALYEARGIRRPGAEATGGIVLCVDTSASMRAHLRSGTLRCLLEIVFGIDRGMGDGGDVPVHAVTSNVTTLPPLSAGNVSAYADKVLAAAPTRSGCRAELLAAALGAARDGRTVVLLTDEVPSGVDACAQQWAGDVANWRVVVLGSDDDLLAARDLTGFGLCAVPPRLDYDVLCGDSQGPPMVRQLITGITGSQPTGVA